MSEWCQTNLENKISEPQTKIITTKTELESIIRSYKLIYLYIDILGPTFPSGTVYQKKKNMDQNKSKNDQNIEFGPKTKHEEVKSTKI